MTDPVILVSDCVSYERSELVNRDVNLVTGAVLLDTDYAPNANLRRMIQLLQAQLDQIPVVECGHCGAPAQ